MIEKRVINIGNTVLCDWCNKDWTKLTESGGFLFGSKATCPECAADIEASCRKYDEMEHIKARCPADMSFAQWVLGLRGGDNTITVISSS